MMKCGFAISEARMVRRCGTGVQGRFSGLAFPIVLVATALELGTDTDFRAGAQVGLRVGFQSY